MTREDIVRVAREHIGDRWQHGQSLKGVASDCGGLIRSVGVETGAIPADFESDPRLREFSGYGRRPANQMMERVCSLLLDPIPIGEMGLADVLLMRFNDAPQHLAIVSNVAPLRVVHAYAEARRVCEMSIDADWRKGVAWRSLIHSCWRFRGVV